MFANRLRLIGRGARRCSRRGVLAASTLALCTALGGCASGQAAGDAALGSSTTHATDAGTNATTAPAADTSDTSDTMDTTGDTATRPDVSSEASPIAPVDVYAHTGVGMMSPAVADATPLIYVPSNDDGSVTVIDQATMQIVGRYKLGKLVQHVVPGWDLRTLYATVSGSNRSARSPRGSARTASTRAATPR